MARSRLEGADMKSVEQRVANLLRGENVCPACGNVGVQDVIWTKQGGERARHCGSKACDVRVYRDGVVLTSGYLTQENREGPGT